MPKKGKSIDRYLLDSKHPPCNTVSDTTPSSTPIDPKPKKKKVHLALLMMIKNEAKRLHVSLESVRKYVSSMVIYDTGSTDNTLTILREFCTTHNIPLRLKEGTFVDFSTSRNVSLEYADTFPDIDFLILLDCNDELRGGDSLMRFLEKEIDNPETKDNGMYQVTQQWLSGNVDSYYNVRLIKPRMGMRYKGVVHEFMYDTNKGEQKEYIAPPKVPADIILFQDRTKDDDKSMRRFFRDKELLYQEYLKDPKEPRTLFYLAQTCGCLQHNEESYIFYRQRYDVEGFYEERFHAALRLGELCFKTKRTAEEAIIWFIRAHNLIERVEPLLHIAGYYRTEKKWVSAFTFAFLAIQLPYPHHCHLFVNKRDYDYNRYHLMGIIGFYANKYKEGKEATLKAIEVENAEIDRNNLKFYLEKEKEMLGNEINTLTRDQYMQFKIDELRKKYPRYSLKMLTKLAKAEYKVRSSKNTKPEGEGPS